MANAIPRTNRYPIDTSQIIRWSIQATCLHHACVFISLCKSVGKPSETCRWHPDEKPSLSDYSSVRKMRIHHDRIRVEILWSYSVFGLLEVDKPHSPPGEPTK